MAKNIGLIQYSGKMGNTVGATKAAGQKANTIRIKPASVKNPKTLAQAHQRMQMRAASNLYTALGEILNHSYQNVEYGAPSHNYFMKLATTKALRIGSYQPAVPKSSNKPYPFDVAIAEGTAPVLPYSIVKETNKVVINSGQNVTAEMKLLEALQKSNSEIREGDQITFVACVAPGLGTGEYEDFYTEPFTYYINRAILNTITAGGKCNVFFTICPASVTATFTITGVCTTMVSNHNKQGVINNISILCGSENINSEHIF
mgnify:CR=1 FL=1